MGTAKVNSVVVIEVKPCLASARGGCARVAHFEAGKIFIKSKSSVDVASRGGTGGTQPSDFQLETQTVPPGFKDR